MMRPSLIVMAGNVVLALAIVALAGVAETRVTRPDVEYESR
jgi:hypothetical protein